MKSHPITPRTTHEGFQSTTKSTQEAIINGWGRTNPTRVQLRQPTTTHQLQQLLSSSTIPVTVRGAGRSYADAAIGRSCIETTLHTKIRSFDSDTGIIDAESGTTLQDLHHVSIPAGWMLPVLPGTSHISVGGAIASDVHGKNHVHQGTFGQHVLSLELILPTGQILTMSPQTHPDQFWATVSGMGLTGIISSAKIQLHRIETSYLRSTQTRTRSIEESMDLIKASTQTSSYSVGWIDAAHSQLRGLVEISTPAPLHALPGNLPGGKLAPRATKMHTFRSLPGNGIINQASTKAANTLRWHYQTNPHARIVHFTQALTPLDKTDLWPAAFGRQGLIQYQFALPTVSEKNIPSIFHWLQSIRTVPALAVLKYFGESSKGLLSFPQPGWTLALDFPAATPSLKTTLTALTALDKVIAAAGGRIYLAKDNRLSAHMLPLMYPHLQHWQTIRSEMDPEQKMDSLLNQRLNLSGMHS
ncbi:FAD-binding oxidoreductase [Pseudarthrobacter sp. PS3-L1]|uniref:FAD-binding oxidoreductase n=1 Tax=Pseudarthrobacter sp. PS3-L1 TaxID=3046207 RepID=UPI0024B91E32|nr:FAD-binding oxidoreductase [Pseudarthrobacter sp. PS3-L1]MDJ0319934.1 FAD-binding oxidoreductase [Pseudarthrobacter sp. PS3-L1]